MSETVYLKANGLGVLRPVDQSSEEIVRGMAGKEVKAVLTMPRNIKHHKKYFALIGLVFDAQSHYTDRDDMRGDIMVALGYCKRIACWDGSVRVKETSISFANMDQTKFDEVYSRTLDFVAKEIIPGVDKADLVREIQELMN